MKFASKLALLGLPLVLVACSTLEGDKVDYQSAVKHEPLSVPPDLSQLPNDNRYATPGTTVSAAGYQVLPGSGANAVAPTLPGMHLEGQGEQRWLVVDQPPEKLWPVLRAFWRENGLTLVRDEPQLGIMETDWAENRAKLPQDFFRRTLGKLLDKLFSTDTLDKYRTRLERTASGGTEVYITHRGLEEVFKDQERVKMAWQSRPSDPELEIEMLHRLMLKLGADKAQADVASYTPKRSSRLDVRDGQPVVVVDDRFDRAWRRVGLSLDRTGFTVEDRNRNEGIYYVRYVAPKAPGQEEPGFFSRLFSGSPKDQGPQKYRIVVRGEGDGSLVRVLDAQGQAEASDDARRILQVIADDLH